MNSPPAEPTLSASVIVMSANAGAARNKHVTAIIEISFFTILTSP
jgi:hypothetical protein